MMGMGHPPDTDLGIQRTCRPPALPLPMPLPDPAPRPAVLPGASGSPSPSPCGSAALPGLRAGDQGQGRARLPSRTRPARRRASCLLSDPLGAKEPPAALSRALCVPQALRDQVRRVPAGHPAHAGGAPRPGLRVPPALLRLRRVQAAAGHGRRVLPHGGQPARVQGRLRDRQAARSVAGGRRAPGAAGAGPALSLPVCEMGRRPGLVAAEGSCPPAPLAKRSRSGSGSASSHPAGAQGARPPADPRARVPGDPEQGRSGGAGACGLRGPPLSLGCAGRGAGGGRRGGAELCAGTPRV